MKTVSVTELKEQLSKYLRRVRRGDEIQIVSHGRPVARLLGIRGIDDDDRAAELAAAGVLRLGSRETSQILDMSPLALPGVDLTGALSEERGDRV
jgi:prevent-host-death family protein